MDSKQKLNHNLSKIGWGSLFVWWGICVLINPITLGMSAIGSGLILLGVNAVRSKKGIEPVISTWVFGIMLVAWGMMDQARLMMGFSGWISFALGLIVFGLSTLLSPLLKQSKTAQPG